MKKNLKSTFTVLMAMSASVAMAGESLSEARSMSIQMFPEKLDGYTRHVIRLPELEGEAMLELLPGKKVMGDTCNRFSASVDVKKESVQGWGYSYWVISNYTLGGSTMMACPDGKTEINVVARNNQLKGLRYNDRMPNVVFVEDGLSLAYNIWRVAPEERSIQAPTE